MNSKLGETRLQGKLLTGAIVALLVGVSFFLRTFFLYHQVFAANGIRFTTNDAYYHMRLVDNLVRHFPHGMRFDPFMIYPGGYNVPSATFFDGFLAGISWIAGLGSPTQHVVDLVGVYLPPVIGALTVVPVYFLGKALLNRWAGIVAAALVAIFPGAFMLRSTLGNTTYHGAEVLLTAAMMLFLLLAVGAAAQRQLSFDGIRPRDRARWAKPALFALLSGIFMAVYFFTWPGALLFTFVVTVYFVLQFIMDHLRRRSTDYLALAGVLLFLPVVVASLIVPQDMFHLLPNIAALLVPPLLWGTSRLFSARRINPAWYPLATVGLAVAGLAVFHLAAPSLFNSMASTVLNFFSPYGGLPPFSATIEMQPLLAPQGQFTLALAWSNYATSFFAGLIGLVLLGYLFIRRGEARVGLMVVWTLVMLAATLAQRRYAYYLAVNLAVLAGYFCARIVLLAESRKWFSRRAPAREQRTGKKGRREAVPAREPAPAHRPVAIGGALLFTFLLLFYPLTGPLPGGGSPVLNGARTAQFPLPDGWAGALAWLRQNTPDPFGDPNFYYAGYQAPAPGQGYAYPASAYGVMSWWDYGYWIVRIAHRLPNVNPGEYREPEFDVARFLMAQDESAADPIAQKLDSRYVIVDYTTDIDYTDAIANSAGTPPSQLYQVYYLPQNNKLVPVTLFYPAFYTTMASRLYAFDAGAAAATNPQVIAYDEKTGSNGAAFRQITSVKSFTTYDEAQAYVASQKTGNYQVVGTSPFISPVPLAALAHYKLVYASIEETAIPGGGGGVPSVKIFQYTP